jgi:hypothetical protein
MLPISGALDRIKDRGKQIISREVSRRTGVPENVVRSGVDTAHQGYKKKEKPLTVAKNVAKTVIKKGSAHVISGATGIPAPFIEKGIDVLNEAEEKAKKYIGKKISDLEKESISRYPRKVQNFLNAHSREKMTDIRVCRRPLGSNMNKVLDFISGGALTAAKKKEKFDSLFHLYLSFKLGGKRVILDKQSNITIKFSEETCADSMPVAPKDITLKEFLEKGRKRAGDEKFFPYNALSNNCQDFLWNLLVANKMSTPALIKFIKQDVEQLAKDVPSFSKKIADTATKVAGLAERAYQNLTEKYEVPLD